jgi:GNAT superfamily N-acetyltransferase
MTEVALATPDDEDALWAMLLDLHEENGIFSVNEQKVRASIRLATEAKGGLIGVIRGDELEASMCLVIDQFWYTDDFCLLEQWLFVRQPYRHKKHAVALVGWAKQMAITLGLKLQAGIMSTERTAAKERMYLRQMTPIGGLFMFDPAAPKVHTGVKH